MYIFCIMYFISSLSKIFLYIIIIQNIVRSQFCYFTIDYYLHFMFSDPLYIHIHDHSLSLYPSRQYQSLSSCCQ